MAPCTGAITRAGRDTLVLNHDSVTVWNQHRDGPPLWLGAWSWLVDSGAIPAITPSAEPLCQLPFLRALPSSEPSLPDRKSPNPPDQCELGTLLGPLYRCVSHSAWVSCSLPSAQETPRHPTSLSSGSDSPGKSLPTTATPFSLPTTPHRR